MRVSSGLYKGQKLLNFPKNLDLRPTTQRVKKSIFDSLRPEFQNPNLRVLDLFSGTGQLSFEVLSQGVLECHAVEQNKKCCQLILQNAKKLKINSLLLVQDKKSLKKDSRLVVYQKDVFSFLKAYRGEVFDLIFIDPPFRNLYADMLIQSLKVSEVCNSQTLIVLEVSIRESLSDSLECQIQKEKNFGDKHVYFFNI